MFRIGNDIHPDAFISIIQELQKKPIPVNSYRVKSGVGRSQCFGLVRQRNNTYSGSRMNFGRPELYQMLITLGNRILPSDFSYTSIQLNMNYQTAPHFDKGNKGESAIVGFGSYTGGELVVEDCPVNIQNRLVFFDGSKYLHHTNPYEGVRYSIVFFTVEKEFQEVPTFSFTQNEKGKTQLQETLGGVSKVYDKEGNCVYSSDGLLSIRAQRKPTLRPCIS